MGVAALNDPTLFCFEVYVHKVERTSLRRSPPAFAFQFLDYDTVIIAPPEQPKVSAGGAIWYGQGKRCIFEERSDVLEKCLRTRAATSLLVLEIENGQGPKRKLFGSGTLVLADFHDNTAELGAVRTWGRVECCIAMTNPYSKIVGVVTLSVSLASFDPGLRAILAPRQTTPPLKDDGLPTKPQVSSPPLPLLSSSSVDGHSRSGIDEGVPRSRTPSPPSASPRGGEKAPSTPSVSPPSLPRSASPSAPSSPVDVARPEEEECVDTTLRMPEASTAAFDDSRKAAFAESLARAAKVPTDAAEVLSWRQGSLIVDARLRFGTNTSAAREFAEVLAAAPPKHLVSYDLFGPFRVLDVAVKRCARVRPTMPPLEPLMPPIGTPRMMPGARGTAATTTHVSESSIGETTRAEAFSSSSSSSAEASKQDVFAPSIKGGRRLDHARTLDVFRGEAYLVDDDDGLGECPPPLFHEAPPPRQQQRSKRRVVARFEDSDGPSDSSAAPGKTTSPPRWQAPKHARMQSPPVVLPPPGAKKQPRQVTGKAEILMSKATTKRPPVPRFADVRPPKNQHRRPPVVDLEESVHDSSLLQVPPYSSDLEGDLAKTFARVKGADGRASVRDLRVRSNARIHRLLVNQSDARRLNFQSLLTLAGR